jgi:hypothetical protein
MKNNRNVLKAVAALVLASTAGIAAAADTQDLSVSATILARCKFVVGTPSIGLGNIDPSGTADVTATADVEYKCTNGTTPGSLAPTSGGLTRSMSDGGTPAKTLAYTLEIPALSAGTGFSNGQEKTVTITGRVTPAQFNDAEAATYTETVELTISP